MRREWRLERRGGADKGNKGVVVLRMKAGMFMKFFNAACELPAQRLLRATLGIESSIPALVEKSWVLYGGR